MTDIYIYIIAIGVAFLICMSVVSWFWARRRPKKLNAEKFQASWKEVHALCRSQETWPLAIINGDKLLDDALKRCRYRGKTMGERLVAAQRDLSDNDAVWYGHKLRNKLVHEEVGKLSKDDVIDALAGIRQALRDLGALK